MCRHQNGKAEIFESQQLRDILIQGFQQHESTNVAQNPTKHEVLILDVPEQTPMKLTISRNFSYFKFKVFLAQVKNNIKFKQMYMRMQLLTSVLEKSNNATDKGNKKAPPKPTWDAKWINNIDSLMARTNKLKALENPSTEVKQ